MYKEDKPLLVLLLGWAVLIAGAILIKTPYSNYSSHLLGVAVGLFLSNLLDLFIKKNVR
jgi:hypothetical protein